MCIRYWVTFGEISAISATWCNWTDVTDSSKILPWQPEHSSGKRSMFSVTSSIECPYVARMAKLAPWFSTCRSRLLRKGSCDEGLKLFLLLVPSFSLRVWFSFSSWAALSFHRTALPSHWAHSCFEMMRPFSKQRILVRVYGGRDYIQFKTVA